MANNLVRGGFSAVSMFDISKERMSKMPKGMRQASSPRELAEEVDVVITGKIMNT